MSDDNQIEIPQSFIALYLKPGRERPSAPRDVVAARYEQCEDMAQTLIEHARAWAFKDNLGETEILLRCRQGLLAEGSGFTAPEASWVVERLAELLDWTPPAPEPLVVR